MTEKHDLSSARLTLIAQILRQCTSRLSGSLLLLIVALSMVGLVVLYSASGSDTGMVLRQGVRLLISISLMSAIAQVEVHKLQRWAPLCFLVVLMALIVVLLMGKIGKGAQRWLSVGSIRFQPSEMMKLFLPMMLACLFNSEPLPANYRALGMAAAVLLLPVILIIKQPDLGTAIMVAFSGAIIIFFAGMSYRTMGYLLGLACVLGPLFWNHLHDYQKLRVINFINPEHDPLGSGYHIIQSKIALGSGGLLGKGYLNGTQSHLQFLPEHSTDFIFAVLGEEFGLLGCLWCIGLFAAVICYCLNIARQCHTRFGYMVVIGLTMNLFFSAFVNIGMVSGILPVVGVPLPLISYGGSSLLTFFAGFGIIMAINAENHRTICYANPIKHGHR